MSGYCPDCGNTQCICKEVEQDQNVARSDKLKCPFCGYTFIGDEWLVTDAMDSPLNLVCSECNRLYSVAAKATGVEWTITKISSDNNNNERK